VIVRWRGDRALADREGMATVYGLSERTVRRYCTPVDYDPSTRRALYDVLAWEETLAQLFPRPKESPAMQMARRSMRDGVR
jgi:hypothetical protein